MNLNTIKRGFTKTNPEKGLRNLPGAQKSERRDLMPGSVRVSGQYISSSYNKTGKIIGLLAYTIAWICNLLIILLVLQHFSPFGSTLGTSDFFLTSYVVLGVIMHIMVIFADGMQNSNAPWARKSIIVFWAGVGLSVALFIPLNIIQGLFS